MFTYEDLEIGHVFDLIPRTITAEEIIAFARKYDPQPFHTDPEAPQTIANGGLIASGWHTSSILMRMMCDSYLLDTASQGSPGLDEVKWMKPVRPGDTLSGTATVVGRRISKKRPDLGLIDFAYRLFNQNDEQVIAVKGIGLVKVAGTPREAS